MSQEYKLKPPKILSFLAVLAFSVALLTLGACNANTSRTEYNGIIVDKFVRRSETQTGTRSTLQLLIEDDDDGERFVITVNEQVFNEAELGMSISRDESGLELNTKKKE